jgi:signal peptidase II
MRAVDDRPREDAAARGAGASRGREREPRLGSPGARRSWALAALVLALVLALDQLSKRAIEHSIVSGEERKVLPGIELVDTRNHGIAFGFLPGSDTVVTILIVLALLALLAYFALHSAYKLIWLPTGMLVGGALGNIVDRIRAGSVTDFVKLPLGWPPFNLADASITLGVLALFLVVEHARRARL